MGSTEIATMVARLTGDATNFNAMLSGAEKATNQTVAVVEAAGKKIGGFGSTLKGFASGAFGFAKDALKIAAGVGIVEVAKAGWASFVEWRDDEFRLMEAEWEREMQAMLNDSEESFGSIAEAVEAFREWLKPVSAAITDLLTASWEIGEEAARKALAAISGAVGGENFDALRDGLVAAVKFAELAVRNSAEIMAGAWGGVKAAAGSVQEAFSGAFEGVQQAAEAAAGWLSSAASAARDAAGGITAVTAVVLGAALAYKAVTVGVAVTSAALAFLKVQQVAGAVLWAAQAGAILAWKGVMLGASAVVALFNVQVAAWTGVVALATGGAVGWSAGALVAKAATWLWATAQAGLNAMLVATLGLLTPAVLLAAAGTVLVVGAAVGVVAVAFSALYASVVAVWKAGQATFAVLGSFGGAAGPIEHIAGVFGDWWEVIKLVTRALSTDMDLAWKITVAGATLAVNQVKDLFPPLWTFLSEGFKAVADLIAAQFKSAFTLAFNEAITQVISLGGVLGPKISAILGIGGSIALGLSEKNAVAIEQAEASAKAAEARLKEITSNFKVESSPQTDAARDALGSLSTELWWKETIKSFDEIDFAWAALMYGMGEQAKSTAGVVAAGFKSVTFDAVLADSNAAERRIQEQRDLIEADRFGPKDAASSAVSGTAAEPVKQTELLKQILGGIDKLVGKSPFKIEEAGI